LFRSRASERGRTDRLTNVSYRRRSLACLLSFFAPHDHFSPVGQSLGRAATLQWQLLPAPSVVSTRFVRVTTVRYLTGEPTRFFTAH